MSCPARLIAHLDMDAFYASVELLRYPELRGQAVVIGGSRRSRPEPLAEGGHRFARLSEYAGRGVVTTATYEARALGVHSAMGMMKAALLAPEAVMLPVDFDEYRKYSRLFKAAVRELCPVVEDRGIDEIYIDLSDTPGTREDGGRAMARRLKDAVRAATGLSCSIAVSPNKLLSKIGSDLDKPDGLTILSMEDLPSRIWPLPARKVNGIGPKASEKLSALGLHTIGEVAAADPALLLARFGQSYGAWLHDACNGRHERPVVTSSEPKSISRETTFERDLHAVRDRAALSELFTGLCTRLAADLVRKGYLAKTIGLKLRFDDFKIVTRDLTLPDPVQGAMEIRHAAGQCLKRVDLSRRLRLLGVRAGGLVKLSDGTASDGGASGGPRRGLRTPAAAGRLPLFDDLPPSS